MILQCVLLIIGLLGLVKGADFFVDGSASLAKNFKIPSAIIGLTIVASGTSAPELAVSVSAALNNSNEIALSNVIGSNLFNLLAVLGVCAVIHPIPIDNTILKRDFPLSLAVTVLTLVSVSMPLVLSGNVSQKAISDEVGIVSRGFSILLLVIFIGYMALLVHIARKNPQEEEQTDPVPVWKCLLLIIAGLACIILGGQFVVNSAKVIASALGMSETLIGLTIVAVGTSLPELVTSVVASRKGQNEMAAGNVIGSNLFNILFILGLSSAIHPIGVNFASVLDLLILASAHLLTYLFAVTKNINRVEGLILVLLYIADIAFAVMR